MDERANAEADSAQRHAAKPNRAAPPVSAEVTTVYDPLTSAEDPAAAQVPAGAPPAGGAEQTAPVPDKGLSFLQPSCQAGSLGRLGHYEVLELLGKGAFGIVFKALDEKLQRLVAIKVLGPQLAGNATARSRFLREARAAAAVNSKYVVTTYEVNEQPIPYLVMEYVAGTTLRARIEQTGALETRDVLRIGAEIAAGLAAAHQRGLIHRDIKPANILLEGGRVKIADFGLARAVDDASLTQSGAVVGTPMFMSPEQARGEALDPRSDLFSLGSVLYTMCTGQPPFRTDKALGVLKRVCDDTPRPIRDSNPDIPEALAALVNRLLVKDPAGRFESAAAVADLLREQLAHPDDPARPSSSGVLAGAETAEYLPVALARATAVPSPKKRPRPRRKWAAAAAVVLLPVLALALTETAGVTHLFRGGGLPTDPGESAREATPPGAHQPAPLVVAPSDTARAGRQSSRRQEKPISKEAPSRAAAPEENPFKHAKVGDWVDYKMTQVANGRRIDGKIRMEVTARTEKTAKVRTITTVYGQDMGSPELAIDLTKPYDPANAIFMGANARAEKVGSGTEKIKVGDKGYETSWAKVRVTAKVNGDDLEANLKYWTARSGPLGGLVKMEATNVLQNEASRTDWKMTMELAGSGSKVHLIEARHSAARGDWRAAAAAYARYFAVQPLEDGEVGFEYATVLLLSGDQPGYHKVCVEMLQHSGQRGIRPYHVARAWTLAPGSVKETALAGQRADNELKQNRWAFWSLTEQGALAYRAGRYEEAAALFEQSLKADGRAGRAVLNWLWLALVEERRGRPAEAGAWLEKAAKWLGQHPTSSVVPDDAQGLHLHNWVEAQVLRREAERALALAKKAAEKSN